MGNVIGYYDDPVERRANWLCMLTFKACYDQFRVKEDEWSKRVAKRDRESYRKFLSTYIRKEM